MVNPYRMLDNWPHLGDIKPGAAIGIVPDGKGGIAPKRLPGANNMIDVNRVYFIKLDKPLK